ncbi:hypothetical protein CFC21_051803 [Triticum aestivum]|uniref:Uncharacterized protein n=4 Tax=Triticum TaxID=4564 RepID=A0A9R0S657_TRITD|nr:hypothetical protein TRIUR3_06579 [Triticum urartu]KAF7042118.1 hypothetical protein CFC21_051803 [Triticum aestivum]VAH89449.1 unnamed protein product [Triticum turgidum subsp. durum]
MEWVDLSLGGLLGGLGRLLGRLGLLALLLRGPLGEQHRVDLGDHAAVRDGDAGQQLSELLVVPDGEQQVARDDAALLVVLGGVPGELQKLGGEVLEDGGEVYGGAGADALGVAALSSWGRRPCARPRPSSPSLQRLRPPLLTTALLKKSWKGAERFDGGGLRGGLVRMEQRRQST